MGEKHKNGLSPNAASSNHKPHNHGVILARVYASLKQNLLCKAGFFRYIGP